MEQIVSTEKVNLLGKKQLKISTDSLKSDMKKLFEHFNTTDCNKKMNLKIQLIWRNSTEIVDAFIKS